MNTGNEPGSPDGLECNKLLICLSSKRHAALYEETGDPDREIQQIECLFVTFKRTFPSTGEMSSRCCKGNDDRWSLLIKADLYVKRLDAIIHSTILRLTAMWTVSYVINVLSRVFSSCKICSSSRVSREFSLLMYIVDLLRRATQSRKINKFFSGDDIEFLTSNFRHTSTSNFRRKPTGFYACHTSNDMLFDDVASATARDLINKTNPSMRRSLHKVSTFQTLSTRIWPRCRMIVFIGRVNFVAVFLPARLARGRRRTISSLVKIVRYDMRYGLAVDFPRRLFRRNASVYAWLYPPTFILHDLLFRKVASLPVSCESGAILLSASYRYNGEISDVVDDDPSILRKKSRLSSNYSLDDEGYRIDTNDSTKKSTNRSN